MRCVVRSLSLSAHAKGGAALSAESLSTLALSKNDLVSITSNGSRYAFARVTAADTGDGKLPAVGLDRYVCNQLGVDPGDQVDVQPATLPEISRMTVRIPDPLYFHGRATEVEGLIRSRLRHRPVREGQPVMIDLDIADMAVGQHVPVRPTDLYPTGPGVVTDETSIEFDQELNLWSPPERSTIEGDGYDEIGGLDDELEKLREMVELPFEQPELFERLNVDPPTGVLLYGPPGTGKTALTGAIAEELDAYFIHLDGPEIIDQWRGVSEKALRETFTEARENAPAVLFIDEIDAIAPKRDGQISGHHADNRLVAQLLTLMDGLEATDDLVVIGATNRIDSIDPALRRGGRFDREIEIGVPDEADRREILEVHTRGVPLDPRVDLDDYASRTHGFVGADLEALVTEAGLNALDRADSKLRSGEGEGIPEEIRITIEDMNQALTEVEPSAMREHTVEVPTASWEDIGGLSEAKARLREAVQWPLEYGGVYRSLDIEPQSGILLAGPPGTGKTLLAKAAANETESNFLAVNGPELMSKWIGQSEANVRELFETARANAPCILFFDEIDAIAGERDGSPTDSGVTDRVVSQLLAEIDGVDALENVIVVATTNRPELIDDALLRPGRLDYHLEIPLPDHEGRREIFDVHTREKPIADEVSFDELVERTDGWSGAEIEALCREAAMVLFREVATEVEADCVEDEVASESIRHEHFERALSILEGEDTRPQEDTPRAGNV